MTCGGYVMSIYTREIAPAKCQNDTLKISWGGEGLFYNHIQSYLVINI